MTLQSTHHTCVAGPCSEECWLLKQSTKWQLQDETNEIEHSHCFIQRRPWKPPSVRMIKLFISWQFIKAQCCRLCHHSGSGSDGSGCKLSTYLAAVWPLAPILGKVLLQYKSLHQLQFSPVSEKTKKNKLKSLKVAK